MAYVDYTDLYALIPEAIVVSALDDDGDGQVDASVWAAVAAQVDREINSRLAPLYDVPLASPVPEAITEIARILAAEMCYLRRGYTADAQNPLAASARTARARLARLGKGEESFPSDGPVATTYGGPAVVSEPSRLADTGGRMLI